MNQSTYKWIVTLLVLVIVIGGAMLLYRSLAGNVDLGALIPTEEISDHAAPDFTVTDPQGREVRLSDFRGRGVVVNFWASSCGPCRSEMPHFQTAYEEYGDQVHFLMIHIPTAFDDTQADAEKILAENGYTFPVYYDTKSECAYAYGITGVPMTVFIDKNGDLVSYKTGAMSLADLERRILTITG